METTWVELALLLILLALSAFFSSSEAAFLSLQRTRIMHLVSTGVRGARRVAQMMEEPERLLSTILLGNNLVNVAFASVVTAVTLSLLKDEGRSVVVATAASTVVLLLLGEIIPKTVAVNHSERMAFLYARPLQWTEYLLLPLVFVLRSLTVLVRRLLRARETRRSITEAELLSLIDIGEAEGTFEPTEAEMLEKVFRFGDRQVREVMTPRVEIVSLPRGATLRQFLDIYAQHSHTRFPVYEGSEDNVVGILSAKDVLRTMASQGIDMDQCITDIVREPYFVPETKRIAELFDELRSTGNQMAIIIDEFGGLAGLITLKRLLEEVVGRVGEEGTAPEVEYTALDEHTFVIDGGMGIEEVNQELGIQLPQGDFETIAGFVLYHLGRIPTQGERFEYKDLTFEITEMRGLRIEKVRVTKEGRSQEPSLETDPGKTR